jgi:uncharacterized protein DUF6011
MGYEDSPGVDLVATNCALCGRPLLDADSVECGMGPTCRARHGAGVVALEPDWLAVGNLVESLPEAYAGRVSCFIAFGEARPLANWAVNRIAADPAKIWCDALILVVAAAGFVRLAAALADRHSRQVVNVEQLGSELVVRAPYNEEFVQTTRHWRGRHWDPSARVVRFPVSSRAALWDALRASFGAGTMVVGANGMRRI